MKFLKFNHYLRFITSGSEFLFIFFVFPFIFFPVIIFNGILFFSSLVLTFHEDKSAFKQKRYHYGYLILSSLMLFTLSTYFVFFFLIQFFNFSLIDFLKYYWIILVIFGTSFSLFLYLHTFLKFQSEKRKVRYLINSLIIVGFVVFCVLQKLFWMRPDNYIFNLMPIYFALISSSAVGSAEVYKKNFELFGSFEIKESKTQPLISEGKKVINWFLIIGIGLIVSSLIVICIFSEDNEWVYLVLFLVLLLFGFIFTWAGSREF
jgi:hypothetical protein